MSPFSRSLFIFCVAALVRSHAAVAPATPPGATAHTHDEPVLLDQFVTSASPFSRSQVDVAQSTNVLSGRALLLKQQATLGETLAAETGIHATSFGPGASRPIIRGLGGDRIRLLENSVGTIDASVTSPDHALSVEPFLVERVEVVRGPASLLYGSSAVGGVVNVITHRIETELPTQRTRGAVEFRYGGAAEEFARGGLLDVALQRDADRAVVFHLDGFRRSADNLRIPGFAESARIRAEEAKEAEEHGEEPPEAAHGELPNSALETSGAAAGLSWVGKSFHLGLSYSGFNSDYGVPGHAHAHAHEEEEEGEEDAAEAGDEEAEGIRIDLRQRRFDTQGEWRAESGFITGVRFKLGRANYEHAEIEPDGAIGTLFKNRGYDARVEALHGDEPKGWHGAVGFQATRTRLSAEGEEAFLPPSLSRSGAVFLFEELVRNPVTWQFGARIERTKIDARGAGSRKDDELSGSLGAIWKLNEADSIAFSLAHTGRAPNAQELFAYGPHAGTQAFEIGDAALDAEKSLGAELSFRRRAGFVTGAITLFANRFNGYIFEQPTGTFAAESEEGWEFLSPTDAEFDAESALPVYRYIQHDARFWGAEVETLWHLHESTGQQLDLKLAADLTRARESGRNLPRIPAARATAGVSWVSGPWSAGAESQFIFDQNRVAANETPSDGYTLVSAYVSWSRTTGRVQHEIFIRGTNLADDEARPHTSFVKELAPLAGRSVTAGVRWRF